MAWDIKPSSSSSISPESLSSGFTKDHPPRMSQQSISVSRRNPFCTRHHMTGEPAGQEPLRNHMFASIALAAKSARKCEAGVAIPQGSRHIAFKARGQPPPPSDSLFLTNPHATPSPSLECLLPRMVFFCHAFAEILVGSIERGPSLQASHPVVNRHAPVRPRCPLHAQVLDIQTKRALRIDGELSV